MAVTVICELAEVELLVDNVHQVWSEAAAQPLPFIESVTILLPPAIVNFKESGVILKMGFVITGTGVLPESFFLHEAENVIIAIIKRNKTGNFFICYFLSMQ
jgi:hypothetical protein